MGPVGEPNMSTWSLIGLLPIPRVIKHTTNQQIHNTNLYIYFPTHQTFTNNIS